MPTECVKLLWAQACPWPGGEADQASGKGAGGVVCSPAGEGGRGKSHSSGWGHWGWAWVPRGVASPCVGASSCQQHLRGDARAWVRGQWRLKGLDAGFLTAAVILCLV